MTDAEHIAIEIAKEYGLNPVRFMQAPAYRAAVAAALQLMSADDVLDGVFDGGGLGGLHSAYAGLIARIEKLPNEHAMRSRVSEDAAESAAWTARGHAANRGQTLADLVAAEQLYADEAEVMLTAEFADEEIRAIAFEAFRGWQA
ncbi:MAG: hypothetical protein ACLQK4_10060 [Acidimicrobiales bacterium]|jgi:hypothetical protein